MSDIHSDRTAPHSHRATVLFTSVACAIAGYALWRVDRTQDREDSTRERVQQLETANVALRNELAAATLASNKLHAGFSEELSAVASLPQQIKDLSAAHEELRARTERPQRAWSRAEALYLLELAQRRLQFDHDTVTAIAAIESADARLASLGEPALRDVRVRIAADLRALRSVPNPDRAQLLSDLSAIEMQSASVPLRGVLVGQRVTTPTASKPSDSLWTKAQNAVGTFFREFVSVHHLTRENRDLVSIDEQALRREHLKLQLFTARSALLRGDSAAFKSATESATQALHDYYREAESAPLAQELNRLTEIDIAPALPNLRPTLDALARIAPAKPQ